MIAPFPLYVDEISPDRIKATVSNASKTVYNLRMMSLDTPVAAELFGNGMKILPVGRFICMLVRDNVSTGIVILDLIDREDLAVKIAAKLGSAELQDWFMEVYGEAVRRPEKHRLYRLVEGDIIN